MPRKILGIFLAGMALAASATPDGVWTGTVSAVQGLADIAIEFSRTPKGLVAAVTMPVMHTQGVKFEATEAANGAITIPALNTTLQLDGDSIAGTFALGQLPIALHRGGTLPAPEATPIYHAGPVPRWVRVIGASTWATPVVRDGIVYLGTSAGQFYAVLATDGEALWTWGGPNRIDGAAAANADSVWFIDAKVDLVCLSRINGTLRWRAALHDAALAGQAAPDNPTFNRRTATPLVIDATVYAGSSDGGIYAFDAATGKQRWRCDVKSPVFSGLARDGADRLRLGCMDGSVVTIDRTRGSVLTRVHAGGGVVTTPVLAGGNVIVGSRDYMIYAFRATDGTPAWTFSYWFSWVESTPAVADGVIYVGASDYRRVTAFDPSDGRVIWATDVRGMAWGTPLVTDDTVFIGTVAQNLPGTATVHTGGIMALDRHTGAVKWQRLAPEAPANSFGGFAGSLALAGELVIAAGLDGTLAALPAK